MSKFSDYTYYHGEKDCPFTDVGKSFWWELERYAFENNDEKTKGQLAMTMVFYLKEKLWEGDGQPDTSLKEFLQRAETLYNKGLWYRSYITTKPITLNDVIAASNSLIISSSST